MKGASGVPSELVPGKTLFRCTWAIFGYKDDPKDSLRSSFDGSGGRVCEKGVKVISGSDQIVVNELDQKISELGKVSSRGRGGRWKRLASRGSGNGGVHQK
ncbi:hypothetical protein LWI29_021937 [Acer saccharum]|uniref:Uncharacterized protein n=1 Tax=Acer saccharum TaxID=4024 RepID=A0AA39RZR5_ACESA|nr:hypothetical protein LWI29_021937 [Acer saccharum]